MRSFKELATEAKKKEMIRVKLGKKKKKIGHVITSPGKDGKPGKVLKRKGMPGQKDIIDNFIIDNFIIDNFIIGEGYKSVEDVKKAFKKEWAAVKSGRTDIGSSKVEKFYSALFDFYADSGEMPLGTQKARTGDPHEWIHDRLGLDEAAGYKMAQSKDPYTVKYAARKNGPVKITVVDGKKAAEKFVKDIKKQGMNGIIVKGASGQKRESFVDEGGMGGDSHFNVKGGSIPSNAEIKAFYEKQKGSHSQKIAATKKHFGLQKMTVSAKGNVSAKGIRENKGHHSNKRPMSAAQKARHKEHQKLLKITGAKKSKVPRKKARGKTEISKTASRYEDIEKEIAEMGEIDELSKKTLARYTKSAAHDLDISAKVHGYKTGLRKAGRGPKEPSPLGGMKPAGPDDHERKLSRTRRNRRAGIGRAVNRLANNKESVDYENETYAPGNTTRMPSPDFDERQGMFNSNYKRINGRSPSKAELRAAGVGKGGDNPKGVKAWKAAMAKLKASNNEEKKLSYKERMKILKDLDMQIGGKGKKGKK